MQLYGTIDRKRNVPVAELLEERQIVLEIVMRSIILSMMMGFSCLLFFETVVPRRKFRQQWMEHTAVLAFWAGFLILAATEVPPYLLQPVRMILVTAAAAQIYFQMGVVKNLLLSVLLTGIYWIITMAFVAAASFAPLADHRKAENMIEPLTMAAFLCLMLVFRYRFQSRVRGLEGVSWGKIWLFPLSGMIVIMAVCMMPWTEGASGYAMLAAAVGLAVVYSLGFYVVIRILEKEAQVQRLQMLHERTQNQMDMYGSMKKQYERQRRYLHDYKNQLDCIRGMLGAGQTEEAMAYITGLTGSIRQNVMYVNTNHAAVNVVLNQKYQDACEKGIVMTMAANDLSKTSVSEEDIVTLLVNLLDNAIEACEKLENGRVIQCKIVLEDGELIISIRNPVKEPVQIRGKRIVTGKRDKSRHGIGLLNVDEVVRKNGGTSVLKCEDGWFGFTAVIPAGEK